MKSKHILAVGLLLALGACDPPPKLKANVIMKENHIVLGNFNYLTNLQKAWIEGTVLNNGNAPAKNIRIYVSTLKHEGIAENVGASVEYLEPGGSVSFRTNWYYVYSIENLTIDHAETFIFIRN